MSAAESYTFKLSKGPSAFDTACFGNIFRYDAGKGEDEAGRSGIWWRDVGRLAVPAALGRSIVLKASLDLRSATMEVTVALDDAPAGEEEAFVIFNGRERQSSLSLPGVKKNLLIGASRTEPGQLVMGQGEASDVSTVGVPLVAVESVPNTGLMIVAAQGVQILGSSSYEPSLIRY